MGIYAVSCRIFIGTAACELPPDWPDDAILAQMVAGAHSYALSLGGAAFSCNSAQCAGWTTAEVLRARWDGEFSTYYSRLAALAEQTKPPGQCSASGGLPAAACYHSVSTGQTEASQNVWLTAVPYLQGVSSPWDADAPGFETAVTYSAEQVYSVLLALGLGPTGCPEENAPPIGSAGAYRTQRAMWRRCRSAGRCSPGQSCATRFQPAIRGVHGGV